MIIAILLVVEVFLNVGFSCAGVTNLFMGRSLSVKVRNLKVSG